ncbi:hypothetical protein LWI29_011622 [Acer saccharum]|uniref:LysM domain-containing protein n=1 Tax=Acer saccharum TaxID=4024 RepID=A0AA39V8B1_ACESA|nr:hypothetical protein LWI29_011622 [Acer saccharum]
MCSIDNGNKMLLVDFVISISILCTCHSFHATSIQCNVSSIQSCPASLYYVPKTANTLKETASLFNVNSNVVNRTVDGFLIGINCSCLLPGHNEYAWHMDYTVQHGDTWKEVSSKFGSFVVEKPAKTLIPSQIVTLDLLCGCSDQSTRDVNVVSYRIESGDTLFTICSRFMADVNETAKLNGLTNPNLILAGDVMFIPGPGKTAGLQKLTLPEDKDPIVRKGSKFQTSVVVVGSTLAAFTIIILVAVALVLWKHYKRNGNQQSIVCRRRADFVHCYLDSCPFHRTGGDSLFLVYEYAQNGALSDHLHKPENRDYKPLPWTARVQIALDVAKDFGLVKLLEHSPEVAATASRIVGTFGYLAPE